MEGHGAAAQRDLLQKPDGYAVLRCVCLFHAGLPDRDRERGSAANVPL